MAGAVRQIYLGMDGVETWLVADFGGTEGGPGGGIGLDEMTTGGAGQTVPGLPGVLGVPGMIVLGVAGVPGMVMSGIPGPPGMVVLGVPGEPGITVSGVPGLPGQPGVGRQSVADLKLPGSGAWVSGAAFATCSASSETGAARAASNCAPLSSSRSFAVVACATILVGVGGVFEDELPPEGKTMV